MFAYIEGEIISRGAGWVVIKTSGIGYRVNAPTKILSSNKKKIALYLHHHLRENVEELYGFEKQEELNFFELLLTVSGVGPKMALAILNQLPVEKLREAIVGNDTTILTIISGVGKKLAAKIIVELKNRLTNLDNLDLGQLEGEDEVMTALKTLGFKPNEIVKALRELPKEKKNVSQKIQWCIKYFGK